MSPGGLHTWFLDGLARNPHGPALAIHGREWTYTELHALAGRYADRLIADAGRPPRRVGILAAKSIEAYAGLLGALYTGAAYVPLGPEVPLARNVAVARSAGVDALITDASGAEQAACLQEVVRDARERAGDDGERRAREAARRTATGWHTSCSPRDPPVHRRAYPSRTPMSAPSCGPPGGATTSTNGTGSARSTNSPSTSPCSISSRRGRSAPASVR